VDYKVYVQNLLGTNLYQERKGRKEGRDGGRKERRVSTKEGTVKGRKGRRKERREGERQ
jgi:hypothetical protein